MAQGERGFAADLLNNHWFWEQVAAQEQSIYEGWLASELPEERERLHAQVTAVREFAKILEDRISELIDGGSDNA